MTMIVLIWVISLLSYSFYAQGVDSNKYDVIFFVQGISLLYLTLFFPQSIFSFLFK